MTSALHKRLQPLEELVAARVAPPVWKWLGTRDVAEKDKRVQCWRWATKEEALARIRRDYLAHGVLDVLRFGAQPADTESVRQHQHGGPRESMRGHRGQRRYGIVEERSSTLDEYLSLAASRVNGRGNEYLRLPHVLCRPGLVRVLEHFGPIEVRPFVLRHPPRVVQQAGLGMVKHLVELATLSFALQVSAQGLKENGVVPSPLHIM
jgi:hypothetical protein